MAKVNGTNSADTLYGTSASDSIYGHGGNDTIKGFGGADHLDGGAGTDTAFYGDSAAGVAINLATGRGYGGSAEGDTLVSIENVWGSAHNDTLTGNDGANELYGLNGNDVLKGGGGTDGLAGGDGDDILKGGGGADFLDGGLGIDTAAYRDSAAGVFVSLMTNTGAYGDAEGDTFSSIENLIGSAHADNLWGDAGANAINGLDGDDTLKGFGGDDTLNGNAGVDIMVGGYGNDTYYVDHANDSVTEHGGQGYDVVRTSVSYYTLTAGADIERLETTDPNGTAGMWLNGNSSDNQIIGNNGHNHINGFGGVDQMIGRGGSDTYYVDHANDSVIENGGQGYDRVRTSVSWTLTPGSDVEVLETEWYEDPGTAPIDLTGNANGNVLIGNDGNNTLNGGDGRDDLWGLYGQDRFLFNTPLNAATNVDRILDFNVADDTIWLDQTIFSTLTPGSSVAGSQFVIGTAALDAGDRIIYNSATGAVYYDSDGTGAAAQIQFAELSPGLALTNFDFLVVTGTQVPSFGGGIFPVDRATYLAADGEMTFSRTSTVEDADLTLSFTRQDYYDL